MAFFSVIRYAEDESSESVADRSSDRSSDILRRLHEAAERKRKSLECSQENGRQTDSLKIPTKKWKEDVEKTPVSSKKKKKKLIDDDAPVPETDLKDEQTSFTPGKKKNKNNDLLDNSVSESSPPAKSSKKTKKTNKEVDHVDGHQDESLCEASPSKKKKRKRQTDLSFSETDNILENQETSELDSKNTCDGSIIDELSSLDISTDDKTPKKSKLKKKKHKKGLDDSISEKHDSQEQEFTIDGSAAQSKRERKIKSKKRKSKQSSDESSASGDEGGDREETGPTQEAGKASNDTAPQQTHDEIGGFTVIGSVQEKKIQKVQRVLPDWLAAPSVIADDVRRNRTPLDAVKGLDDDLVNKLRENGIKDFFPVQGTLLPVMLSSVRTGGLLGNAGYRPCDICCSAPTGSGKTLAYVLPIVQTLRRRCVPQVRALVVLPVRELVTQVYNVFNTYSMGLKVGQIIGRKSFASTQEMLVKKGLRGYHSQIDILVSTPGRLVDHINNTPGFSLKHLRYLVIDEADRMMDEIDHDWLSYVENAVFSGGCHGNNTKRNACGEEVKIYGDIKRLPPGPLTARNAAIPQIPLQKLLFSATLSQNPEKLQLLNLFQPALYTSFKAPTDTPPEDGTDVSLTQGEFLGKYTTPVGLTEYYIETPAGEKPLVIMYLLLHLRFRHILCFTNTVEATHRLYWLLKLAGIKVREMSSELHAEQRSRTLKLFAEGSVDILICSDAMARGMDIDNVKYVLSYDMPPYLKTYIHRVGRTARAGKAGIAMSLLEQKQLPRFRKMLSGGGKAAVEEFEVNEGHLEPYVEAYTDALRKIPQMLKAEKRTTKVLQMSVI